MLLGIESGCKVGWAFYDDQKEAEQRARDENVRRVDKAMRGYDFGYQWPGSITRLDSHPKYGDCWMVVTT